MRRCAMAVLRGLAAALIATRSSLCRGGRLVDRLPRPGAARGGARILDAGGRPRRQAAAALHHAGRPLAAAGDARAASIRAFSSCCSPTRTSASRAIAASIRSRSAARSRSWSPTAASSPAPRPSPCRWRGCSSRAPSAPSRRSCGRWCARSRSSARSPRTRSSRSISASRPMAAISKACARPRSPISARSRAA